MAILHNPSPFLGRRVESESGDKTRYALSVFLRDLDTTVYIVCMYMYLSGFHQQSVNFNRACITIMRMAEAVHRFEAALFSAVRQPHLSMYSVY